MSTDKVYSCRVHTSIPILHIKVTDISTSWSYMQPHDIAYTSLLYREVEWQAEHWDGCGWVTWLISTTPAVLRI